MAKYTDSGLYVPRGKIALASSFEGIVNDGARECGLVSLNACMNLGDIGCEIYDHEISPQEFNKAVVDEKTMQAFLKFRPLVEVAEDYLTVLQTIMLYPGKADELLNKPDNPDAYRFLEDEFNKLRGTTGDERDAFNKAFYDERDRLMADDFDAWLSTQQPYKGSIEGFRELAKTQKAEDGRIVSGFVPWFATSKDFETTSALCNIYSELIGLPDDDAHGCPISMDRIISKEITKDKLDQMFFIMGAEQINDKNRVWRFNDRYDTGQQNQLSDEGFKNQFIITGGYAAPHNIQEAREDELVTVIERKGFHKQLANYAKENDF